MDITKLFQSQSGSDLVSLQSQTGLGAAETAEKVKDIAQKFEGVLLHQMFKQGQQTIDQLSDEEDGESDDGNEQIQSLFWSQMSEVVSQQGGIGLWKSIYGQAMQQIQGQNAAAFSLDEEL